MLCAKIGKRTCTLYEQKTPVYIQILRGYTGIGDAVPQSPGGCGNPIHGGMWKHHPRGCCGNPAICLKVCSRPKKFKRLATCDTPHGSRPNLRQRDPIGRVVPTPSDVSDKGASTKRCARRKKNVNTRYDTTTSYFFIIIILPSSHQD